MAEGQGVGAIDGVDITPEMLALAEKRGVYRRLSSATSAKRRFPPRVTGSSRCRLPTSICAELAPAYREAARLLMPGGQFLLVGYHPFFLMNGLVTHFHRAGGEAVTIQSYVHLLSDHFRAGSAAGLALAAFEECVIDEDWLTTKPKWRRYLNWPVSFAMVWSEGVIPKSGNRRFADKITLRKR